MHWLQQNALSTCCALLGWLPVPLQALQPCIPNRGIRRGQKHPWFTRVAFTAGATNRSAYGRI